MRPLKIILAGLILTILSSVSYAQVNTAGADYQLDDFEIRSKHFRAQLNFGYSKWFTTIPDSLPYYLFDYIKGLQEGLNVEVNAKYYLNSNMCFGLKYAYFNAYNQRGQMALADQYGNIYATGYISDKIDINFVGVSIGQRINLYGNKSFLEFNLIPGYFTYRDYQHIIIYDREYKGNTFGLNLNGGLDFIFSSHFGMGISLDYFAGNIKELSMYDEMINETEKYIPDKPEKMDRINFNFSFSFYY